jgi:hypothetical protein
MKAIALSCCLAAFVCGIHGGYVSPAAAEGQTPNAQPGNTQSLNQPVDSTMTCEEFEGLLKSGDQRRIGLAILWLDGYYSGRAGLTELPVGWVRTVSQGLGGTCAVSVNAQRSVLDVIGQLHREYAGRN